MHLALINAVERVESLGFLLIGHTELPVRCGRCLGCDGGHSQTGLSCTGSTDTDIRPVTEKARLAMVPSHLGEMSSAYVLIL